ncbi:hypothetical protein ANME2D_03058 [Candidatus Methanoperedens nitroreducens]|uniref:Uncharacterized protein n=1 Tax=Candidatus Methanoperedens nitratireducens TaxID=1392998 RepID=A0A062V348_9EURY|nr:hypothetical protein [Candidatus Methanoperedens nitroreducens]KCZ71028.1 hypothetical protein ANME2D_03058 [Candidatus Methanoperedens nitroreducens]MDJ1421599.1 hypothetical protein [Candidatus Methanoperedens sp.]
MGRLKRTVSAVMTVLIALNIFTGLAAATPDVYAEPPDVSDSKASAYTINCPNYDISLFIGGDISSGTDKDRYKCSVNSGDRVNTWIESGAFVSGISSYEDDEDDLFLERNENGNYYFNSNVQSPPVYSLIYKSNGGTYSGYEFFLARNWSP